MQTKNGNSGMHTRELALFLSIWALSASLTSNALAQGRDAPRQVVDVIHFKHQKPIRGLVLDETPNGGISISVSKKWLERDNPEAYAKALESAEKRAIQARLQLRDRLTSLADSKTGAFGFIVNKELERIELEIAKPHSQDYQFVVLQIKSANVTSRNLASISNRRIAVWSWHEGLTDVETRTPTSLENELKSKGIDFNSMPPSLASRFYPSEESDEQWNIRLGIVSQRLEKSIEFQGTSDLMVAVGGDQPPDIGLLMGQMLQSQANSLLQELANGGKKPSNNQGELQWIQTAITQAEKMNAPYFRATQVKADSLQGIAMVDSVFMVKQDGGAWVVAWKSMASQKSVDQKQEAIERIQGDPQLKEILKHISAIGGASSSLDSAIRIGAATMTAQRSIDDAFQHFSDLYLKRLNSPPIQTAGK